MKIAILPGDGIGPEVTAEALRVLDALSLPGLVLFEGDVGGIAYKRHGHPLPAAAINWTCALTASALPERNPYPSLYSALSALLDAVCNAPSARGWAPALAAYEVLLLRELGYGGQKPEIAGLEQALEILRASEPQIARYLLADTRADVLAARALLMQRLERMS